MELGELGSSLVAREREEERLGGEEVRRGSTRRNFASRTVQAELTFEVKGK